MPDSALNTGDKMTRTRHGLISYGASKAIGGRQSNPIHYNPHPGKSKLIQAPKGQISNVVVVVLPTNELGHLY